MWFLPSEGTLVQVTGTRVWTESERDYNLTLQDLHTYYVVVGETPVLIHNSGGCPTGARGLRTASSRSVMASLGVMALRMKQTPGIS
ncbi:hypothetical protein GCM10009551_019660 [Nocardiopsis tropica]